MKRLLVLLSAVTGCLLPVAASAAPVTVPNPSFESPSVPITGTTWSNALQTWTGTNGSNDGNAFVEYIAGFRSNTPSEGNNRQHLGVENGYDVWQDLTTTYAADTKYTLTVGVGNRAGASAAGNLSTYSLGTNAGTILATGSQDATVGISPGNFGDGAPIEVDTAANASVVGQRIRVLLQARGAGRSHFDNIRVDAVASVPAGRAAGTVEPATNLTVSGATLHGTVTDIGSAAPSVVFYYGTADGGSVPANWQSSQAVSGTPGGAFSANITGLEGATNYFYTALFTNGSGSTWATSVRSFSTTSDVASVVTLPASNIQPDGATVGGRVTNTGGDTPALTLFYGPADGGTTVAAWASSVELGSTADVLTTTLTGLTPGVTYHCRVRAVNAGGTSWAPASVAFLTRAVSPAVLVNKDATGLSLTGATLNAEVTSIGHDAPVVTFYYGLTDGGTNAASWSSSVPVGLNAGAVSKKVSGLTSGVQYYFRAAALNAAGTSWAPATFSFLTETVTTPKVATRAATHVTNNMAAINGEVTSTGNEAPSVILYWGPADGGTSAASWAHAAPVGTDSGNVSRILTGLSAGTAYYFRAWASNSAGSAWAASTLSFTTAASAAATGVVINEINYDPSLHTKQQEFIELYNPTGAPIDLTGWQFTSGVDYTFGSTVLPAGGYLCVVQNVTDFSAKWPAITNRVGPWTGSLRNSGETVELRNAAGTLVDSVDYSAGFPWPSAPAGGGTSIELLDPGLDNSLGGSWRASNASPTSTLQSPGVANAMKTADASAAPPAPRDVHHSPEQPQSGVPVVVTATVTDPDGVGSVVLRYQIVKPGAYIRRTDSAYNLAANWTDLTMTDDGTGGDATAGDSIYTATIPPEAQSHRWLVRYQITLTDTPGNSVRIPYPDDEQLNFAYFCYDSIPAWSGAFRPTAFGGFAATPVQDFPVDLLQSIEPWHLIANQTDIINCQYTSGSNDAPFRGTLVYHGVVYDHIIYKNRGIGSTYVSGKNKWALKFNRTHDFQPRDNWGRKYNETWNSVSLDANASPWASVHRGSAGIEEASSYRIFELGGVNALRTNYVHFRIIRRAEEVNPALSVISGDPIGGSLRGQYSGDLWGLYLALEPMETNFINERGIEDGNIYSIEGNNGDQKHQSPTQPTGSDWSTFRNGLATNNQSEAWYRANEDLPNLYTFLGLSRLIGNVDVRPGDNYRYYHRPGDNRWLIMPYDLDMMYIPAHHWGGTINGTVVAGMPNSVISILRHPAIALEYRNRCRELLSLMAGDAAPDGGQIGQLLDEYAQMVNPAGQALTWADLDAAMWNIHPRTAGGGANSGQSSHRGNFFRALYLDGGRGGLGGTTATGTWRRQLSDPDNNSFGDHEGIVEWMTNFATNTYPADGAPWIRKATSGAGGGAGTDNDNNRQKGYGYKYLEWESLYGGYGNANVNPSAALADTAYPDKPVITYAGADGFPANDLRFSSTGFSDPQGIATFGAVQWRIGEISAPGIPGYDPTAPRIYELENVWTSAELPLTSPTIDAVRVPASVVRNGHTYRARVRHQDATGRWSYWSEPVQFIVSTPDTAAFADVLRISEINYNPAAPTVTELLNAAWDPLWTAQDFEFLELLNIGTTAVDLTDVRFTKGVDYDFPSGYSLAAGARVVIAKNPEAFAIRYGAAVPLAPGSYAGDSLSNGGEEIKLSYGTGTAIHDFTYGDKSPWPESPDGGGATLVLVTPQKANLDHGLASEWTASTVPDGTPGTGEPAGTTYAQWAAGYPGLGAATADDDGDGMVNLMEFALSGNPKVASRAPLPVPGADAGQFILTFTHPSHVSGLTTAVDFSDELQQWDIGAVLVERQDNGDGTTTDTWRAAAPAGTYPRLFGRVRAVLAP